MGAGPGVKTRYAGADFKKSYVEQIKVETYVKLISALHKSKMEALRTWNVGLWKGVA